MDGIGPHDVNAAEAREVPHNPLDAVRERVLADIVPAIPFVKQLLVLNVKE